MVVQMSGWSQMAELDILKSEKKLLFAAVWPVQDLAAVWLVQDLAAVSPVQALSPVSLLHRFPITFPRGFHFLLTFQIPSLRMKNFNKIDFLLNGLKVYLYLASAQRLKYKF